MSIIQGITLTTYGNAFLKAGCDISKLTLDHPAFRFNNKVNFHVIKPGLFPFSKPHWTEYSSSPIQWLNKLKKNGCKELRMVFEPDNSQADDHKLAGFVGGGGRRYIETVFKSHSDFWQYKTELTKKDDPERKIWTSSYGRVRFNQSTSPAIKYNLGEQKGELWKSLISITDFARSEKLDTWADTFQHAINMLDAEKFDEHSSATPFIPKEKITLTLSQLFAAAGASNVFGGMGSWNDIGFREKEKEDLYDKLSAELYAVMNQSFLAIANS